MKTEIKKNIKKKCSQLTKIRNAKQRIIDAKLQPAIHKLIGEIWQTNELHLLFADTGLGKSILAVAFADALSKGKKFLFLENDNEKLNVLYYDFELSDRQFRKRYSDEFDNEYDFAENFYIDNIDFAELSEVDPSQPFEEILFEKIKHDIEEKNATVLIIDNITFLKTQTTQKTDVALDVMRKLNEIKKEFNISILVLAHTPKIDFSNPLTINSMAGSKHLSNFADGVSAIGKSLTGNHIRYIKQIKPSRSAELLYDADNVITCEIEKNSNFLTFNFLSLDNEFNHLIKCNKNELKDKAIELKKQGKPYSEIALIIFGNENRKGTIYKWLNPKD